MPWFQLTGDERLHCRCASEGCGGQPTWRLEAGGIGSVYCSGCHEKIESDPHWHGLINPEAAPRKIRETIPYETDVPTKAAASAYSATFEREIDDIALRIVATMIPTPHPHAGGILLLCATRLLGHLAGHLDNIRAANGEPRRGAEASMHEAYVLMDAGRPQPN